MLNTTTAVDWPQQLFEQLQWHWDGQARPRLDGLSDDEYHWAPVADSWDVRRRSDSGQEFQPDSGDWTCDFANPEPVPAPVTTRSLTIEDLHRKVGDAEGPWAEHSMAELVLHINREAIHHLSEIAVLRDLYLRQPPGR